MTAQPSLFDPPAAPVSRLDAEFRAFHEANPEVYRQIVKAARFLAGRGHTRGSVKRIVEDIRWEVVLNGTKSEGFKLNNSLVSRYSREVMKREPDLRGFFETRRLKS